MRNRLSKVMAVVLSFLMIATTFSYAAGSDQFSDVQSGSWYVPYVDFVVDNGYMNGTSATTFEPNGNLTRAMFATILARYDGATVDNSKETAFSDVPVNQWYTGSIGWANEKSIVNGTGNGKFSPNNNITRQDLCVMVERYITYVETTTTKRHVVRDVAITFTDEADIDSYAKSAVDKAVIHGLVNGYPDGSFKPKQFITRAECAAIISRIAWVEGDGKDSHTITVYDEKGKATKVEVPTGETYTIPEGPTKANATFKSWNTQKDGKGTTYNPGEKILLTEDMSLYPIYEEEPVVDPGGGGGGGPVVPVEEISFKVYDSNGLLKSDAQTKNGRLPSYKDAGADVDGTAYQLITGTNPDGSFTFVMDGDAPKAYKPNGSLTDEEKNYLKNNGLYVVYPPSGKDVVLFEYPNNDPTEEPEENGTIWTLEPNDNNEYIIPTDPADNPYEPYAKEYVGLNTEKTYEAGNAIDEDDLGDNGGLIVVYYNYIVEAEMTIASGTSEKKSATLQKIYTIKKADDDPTVDQIAEDLITGTNDANKTAIKNYIKKGLERIVSDRGPKTIEMPDGTYTVKTTKDREVIATKDGQPVNLPAELAEEQEIYMAKMAKVGEKSGVSAKAPDEWTAFAEAISPANLFTASGNNLVLVDEEGAYDALKNAVAKAKALHTALGTDQAVYEQILVDSMNAGLDLGVFFNAYTVDNDATVTYPNDLQSKFGHIAEVAADKDGVLVDLVGIANPYTVFAATETVNSEEDAVRIINERTSRDFSNNYKVRAILQAVVDAYTGDYGLTITVERQ